MDNIPTSDEEYSKAKEAALRKLNAAPCTVHDMEKALTRKGFSLVTIDNVIQWCLEYKFLDDENYARMWVKNRADRKMLSLYALKQELHRKGIPRDIADKVLEEEEYGDDFQHAYALANKQLRKLTRYPPEVQRKRLYALLQRHGFNSETIHATLNSLENSNDTSFPD